MLVQFGHRSDLTYLRQRVTPLVFALLSAAAIIPSAHAQKYRGTTLDDVPPQQPYTPPPALNRAPPPAATYIPRQPMPSRPAATAGPRESEPDARALADRLPLDPATANLEARNPADLPGTMRQLGLRVPNGPRTDLRSHTPSTRELVDALRH